MRLDFDKDVPLLEQIMRVSKSKQPGRRHQHKPGSRVNEKRKASRVRASKIRSCKAKKFKEKVAAYWRGELQTFPQS